MKPKSQTFYSWLRLQRQRTDRIGDLARYAAKNPSFPRQARERRHVRAFLECEGAKPEQLAVLETAWAAYKGKTAQEALS